MLVYMPIKPERLEALLESIVNIYSPTGKELEVTRFVTEYLRNAGFRPELLEVEKDRENVVVMPPAEEPSVCFTGHLDTVAASDYQNYEFYSEGEELFGLGTSDMKGGCAAMIEAFQAFFEDTGALPPACLALVVGEEELGDGTEALLEEYQFSWAVVGEPTNLIPCFEHYGYIEAKLTTRGTRMHASQATGGVNAVHAMLSALLKLTDYLQSEKGDVIFNIRDVLSARSGFVVPDYCEAWLDLHLPPQYPAGTMIYEVEEFIRALFPNEGIEELLSFVTIRSGYALPEKGPFPEALREVYLAPGREWRTSRFPSDSDAIIFWDNGVRRVILGPGSLEKAHREDESVERRQVIEAAQLYYELLRAL